jgi:predicted dehydrogenase
MSQRITRRRFGKAAAAAVGLTAASASSVLGANERVRLGFVGVGNRGQQLQQAFAKHQDCQAVAFCDVWQPYLDRARQDNAGKGAAYVDFRRMYDRGGLDAVVIATPDHWHAIQTIDACDRGMDVYVEKPLSIVVHEGRRMVAAARRNRRIVQVGLHRRSSKLYSQLAEMVQAGGIGKVTVTRTYRLSNMFPNGIGKAKDHEPLDGLNWDLWLGPRPQRPFRQTIHPYKFRWWHLYSSQMANWGVHYLDAICWVTGETAPASVSAHGGRFAVDDDRTIPDTLEAVFQFASGRLAIFGQYEASGAPALRSGEVEFRGTQAAVYISERSYEIVPERGGQFQDRTRRMEPKTVKTTEGDLTVQHARNFLDCLKSRKPPNADVEIGHRSTTLALLANIALATGLRLQWDPKTEKTDHPEANKLLTYEYRKPWVLR